MVSALTIILFTLGQCSGGSCSYSYGGYGGYRGYSGYGLVYSYPATSYATYAPAYAQSYGTYAAPYTAYTTSYAAPVVTYAQAPTYAQASSQVASTTAAQPASAPVPTTAKQDVVLERIATALEEIRDNVDKIGKSDLFRSESIPESPTDRKGRVQGGEVAQKQRCGVRKPKISLDW